MLKSPSLSKQQERWWGFRPQEKQFDFWLQPVTFPSSFPHLLEQFYLSASSPGWFLCRNWMELLNPGFEWFHGYCKYCRWDAGLFNASVSFVKDLLRSGFHLCLHMCWTCFWCYSEGGKEFVYLKRCWMDLRLILDSLSQQTILNKTLKKKIFFLNWNQKSILQPFHFAVSCEGEAGNFLFFQLKQVIRFWIHYDVSRLL